MSALRPKPRGGFRCMTSPLSLLLLGALLGGPGQAEPRRITVPPITTDDHSYRSWLGTAELGDVVVANLGTLPDVALIERTDLGKIEGERALASAGLSSLTAMPPLQGAEWSVTIHLGEARENRRPLHLEVFSLARDQVLIRTNFDLAVPLLSRLSGRPASGKPWLAPKKAKHANQDCSVMIGSRSLINRNRRAGCSAFPKPSMPCRKIGDKPPKQL